VRVGGRGDVAVGAMGVKGGKERGCLGAGGVGKEMVGG